MVEPRGLLMKAELFTSVFLRLKPRLMAKAKGLVGDDDAADVLQDVFFKLWQKRDDMASEREAEGQAVMAVRNMGIDYLRRRSSRREDPVGDSTDISDASMVDDDDESAKAERLADVTRIIERELTERQCSILYMRDRYGYSIEEIACHYSLSEANVRMILSRARNTVRECYIKYRQK